uniref:Rab-GAP TBC domain-containing protein n=1 Tax=Caenorhabditis japonica TaxID=281687 RepID=A0A8R1EKJ3_CAEJA
MARAFYGWLTYVRHLRTIRTHLLHLVNTKAVICGDDDFEPVDEAFWKLCRAEPTKEHEDEFLQRVYWRGIEGVNSKEVRRMAWPYLLGLFEWDEHPEAKMEEFTQAYWQEIDEWRVLEAEVRRRDEEAFRAARARKAASPVREESCEVFEDPNEPTCSNHYDRENLISLFRANLHRIDKDVERCDRNLMFFSNKDNLESLRRVMYTYVRRNLEEGYTQGMCDLLAPLLVTFEDEALTLECFSILMLRQRGKFPQRPGMSKCLLNLRSLIQVVDPQIYALIADIDYAQALSFAFRWFLLDFKRGTGLCTFWASMRGFGGKTPENNAKKKTIKNV